MNYITLDKISNELKKQLRNQSIYPVIGAGFSAGCNTKKGKTPKGDDLKDEMLKQIESLGTDISTISSRDLKQISKYYKTLVPRDIRTKYLINNFTQVLLNDLSTSFLNINWKYLYTFNIDTGIEDNSRYNNVILPNKPGDEKNISSMKNCLFKVHGDVLDYCKYTNSECYVFDSKEYVQSITQNTFILNKMKHDFTYNNLLFIGCSLSDELDLLSIILPDNTTQKTTRYYVTDTKPDTFKEIDLDTYGITDIILVDNYMDFYNQMYNIYIESQKIELDALSDFLNPSLNFIGSTFDLNKDFFYLGKSLFNSDTNSLSIPNFFVERTIILDNVIPEMTEYNIQFLCGGRISGKSYALASIAKNIRDRDVYFFDSRYSLSQQSIKTIINKKNCVICFDSSSISKDQIFLLKDDILTLCQNNINVIICINRSDKDIITSIKKLTKNEKVTLYEISNSFSDMELAVLNKRLPQITIPNFDIKKSILDNLLISSKVTSSPYKKSRDSFDMSNVHEMSIFIILAINEKISSQEFVDFNVEREVYDLLHKLSPIIDEDYTNIIERDTLNSSSYKIYANSRYWILSKLGDYASDFNKHPLITSAYHNIIESLIKNHGNNYRDLEDYIKYDVINEIFFRPDRGNLALIKALYDDLNDLLASEPQFYHQKAKCYLWHCDYSSDRESEINDALRFAKLAKHNLTLQSNLNNAKVMISLAHIDFTIALIYAKINTLTNYDNTDIFKGCILALINGLTNPLNKDYFYGLLKRKNKRINDINNFYNFITTNDLSTYNLSSTERRHINELINFIFNSKR
jgi:hypothetical protein